MLQSPRNSVTNQLLQKTGMSLQTASLVDGGLSIVGSMGGIAVIRARQLAAFPHFRLLTNNVNTTSEVIQLEERISSWLGEGTQCILNKAGDPIFLSRDRMRKVRFDFNRPYPHESPHLHFERFVNGEWKEINRIYPIDVPHK